MTCAACDICCRCVDTRDSLGYGLVGPLLGEGVSLVKERKYVCPECGLLYFTREYVVFSREGNSKDKRV